MVWHLQIKPKTEGLRPEWNRIQDRYRELGKILLATGDREIEMERKRLDKIAEKISAYPEDTLGLKQFRDVSTGMKMMLYEKYILPKVKKAMYRPASPEKPARLTDMTFSRYCKEQADHYVIESASRELRRAACIEGRFCSRLNPLDFEYHKIYWQTRPEYEGMIPGDVSMRSESNFSHAGMLDYAAELDECRFAWEKNNKPLMELIGPNRSQLLDYEWDTHWSWRKRLTRTEYRRHMEYVRYKHGTGFLKMLSLLERSSYPRYRCIDDAVRWLRFWGGHGHSVAALPVCEPGYLERSYIL
jgi:hypothetical protein